MKNLILCAIASLFLFTSCFEKEEEVTLVPEIPIEFDVMKCDEVKKFIDYVAINPPRAPRPTLKKYKKDNDFFCNYLGVANLV